MFRCYICRALHNAPSTLIQHFKFFHGLYLENVHNVSVVASCDLRYFKPFDLRMSYGTDSSFYDGCII